MNILLLRRKMKENRLNLVKIADLLDIDPATLWRKRSGMNEFTRKEILILRDHLHLTDKELIDIFFDEPSSEK
ncbi:MAG: hypothetical protein IIZ48_03635 [Erysipelotrichales bacterium]|nr:hypothetical protein [Erysipelotrichales bacterium]